MNRPLPELTLARYDHDRDHAARLTPGLLDELWTAPTTRVLVMSRGRALMTEDGGSTVDLVPPTDLPDPQLLVYLGRLNDVDATRVVAAVYPDSEALAMPERWGSLRDVAATLDDRDAGLFTEALGMVNWHSAFGFAPHTGEPTEPIAGGWIRRTPSDGREIYPRTDPAVIMRVHDADGRLLLGRNVMAPERYSLLAGFVEPGESLEAAVIREVHEESGLTVGAPEYLGSQPWPFPASLMAGFRTEVVGDSTPTPDGEEILELRWFTREQVGAEGFTLPGRASIARSMIEQWLRGDR
jgi:NAD+ diphosphatase